MAATSSCRHSDRHGLSLVETLAVIAIIALVAVLLLPAVAYSRRQALRTACASRLAGLGKAVWQYHGDHGCFPLGRRIGMDVRFAGTNPPCTSTYFERSVHVALLEFVDAGPFADMFNHSLAVACVENTTSFRASSAAYYCPADSMGRGPQVLLPAELDLFLKDPIDEPWRLAATSYVFAFGTHPLLIAPSLSPDCKVPVGLIAQCNGLFNDVGPIGAAHLHDGASRTAMATEQAAGRIRAIRPMTPGGASYCKMIVGNIGETLATAFTPPNRVFTSNPSIFESIGVASSFHAQGVNVLFADGSVQFVDNNVESWNYSNLVLDAYGGLVVPARLGIWQHYFDRRDGGL